MQERETEKGAWKRRRKEKEALGGGGSLENTGMAASKRTVRVYMREKGKGRSQKGVRRDRERESEGGRGVGVGGGGMRAGMGYSEQSAGYFLSDDPDW